MSSDNLARISGLIRQARRTIADEYLAEAVIFGSAAIVLNGIDLHRAVDDLDIFVSEAAYARLEDGAFETEEKAPGVVALHFGAPNIEIFKEFPGVSHAEVLRNAAPQEGSLGMRVASLDDLMTWKYAQNRKKDRKDIAAIQAHLKRAAQTTPPSGRQSGI